MLTLDWEVLEIMRYVDVITTANNTITYPELLYMFRGRRLDDKITEAILDRLRLLLQLQENAVLNKQYVIVSTYFCLRLWDIRYLYVRAILQKGDVLHVTPADDSSEVVRARLAAELIKEGWEFKNRKGIIAVEDPELKASARAANVQAKEECYVDKQLQTIFTIFSLYRLFCQ
ncbi:uncharacterized protein LOC109824235 isoform X1 [Asparagus officinalis]|uniref:uncharacterized protein LOC109824235 isoform X1 n=1 Tax=Asparagus officinalis TaxID=4686 RepID=UPI00098E7E59|nr:uncharacterized protein LOC109824235 isoform X1 [Asparagus officinalis]